MCRDFSSEGFQVWMKKNTWLPTWRHFSARGVLQRSNFLGNLKFLDKSRPSTLSKIKIIVFMIIGTNAMDGKGKCVKSIRATSHMRLRARDQYTSSTLIGGKGGAGPSSLHTTLEGPMEYVNIHDGCKVYMDSYMASNGSYYLMRDTSIT